MKKISNQKEKDKKKKSESAKSSAAKVAAKKLEAHRKDKYPSKFWGDDDERIEELAYHQDLDLGLNQDGEDNLFEEEDENYY